MRFQQLKRNPDTITRKKLYKSGKNWIVTSSLTLVSGLVLLSFNQTTVKADTNSTASTESATNTQTSPNTPMTQKTQATAVTAGDNTGTTVHDSNSAVANQPTTNSNGKSTTATPSNVIGIQKQANNNAANTDSTDNIIPTAKPQAAAAPLPATQTTANDATPTTTSSDIASSSTFGKIGGDTGSDWNIDSNGALHIQAGTWSGAGGSNFWSTINDAKSGMPLDYDIKSVSIDGPVVVPAEYSLEDAFNGDVLMNSFNFGNGGSFDTSKVTNFTSMFNRCISLSQFDFSKFDFSNAIDIGTMFNTSGLTNVSLKNMSFPNVAEATAMFQNDPNLKSVDLSGTNFENIRALGNYNTGLNAFLADDYNLTSITLDGFKAPGANIDEFFEGDNNLSSLDLSPFNLNNTDITSNNMLTLNSLTGGVIGLNKNIHLKQITLSPNDNISQANLTYNNIDNDGWISEGYPTPIADLATLYDGTDHGITTTKTWTLSPKPQATYTINYVTNDGTVVGSKTGLSGSIGETPVVPNLLGYSTPTLADSNAVLTADNTQVFTANVASYIGSYTVGISVQYTDNPTKNVTFNLEIPAGVTDSATDINQTQLDAFPTDNSFNNDSSNIDYYKVTSSGSASHPVGLSLIGLSDTTSVKNIVNDAINYVSKNYGAMIPKTTYGQTIPGFLTITYDKYEAPVVTPPNSGSSNSSSNDESTTTSKEVDDLNQTSATYYDQPKVQVYDLDGNAVTDSFLNPNTSWFNDKQMILNGTTYYRVAINAWVKASDVYVYTENNTHIRVYNNNYGNLVTASGTTVSNRMLKPSTDWISDRTTTINGAKYYRVSTNEFVNVNQVYEYTYDSPVISTTQATTVYDERGNAIAQLPMNQSYTTDRFVTIDGSVYYRVATNEFVKAEDVNL
ncbi:hypothetical protein CPR19088_GLDEOEPO_00461 [Companilactobacillus paralimentarius]